MSRPESTRTAAIYALSEDGGLTARGVADELEVSVQVAAAYLFKLYSRGRLTRTPRPFGFLYTRPAS